MRRSPLLAALLLAAAPAALQLWAMIETCAAIVRLDAIAGAGRTTGAGRLSLFVIGTNDLAREMRAPLTPGRAPFLPLLSLAVCAARAHGLAVLDGVCNEFRDLAAFADEARQGVAYGFDGKTLIHPAQIEPCNAAFAPSPDEIAWSRRIVEAFAAPENAGKGAIKVEGRMVELLHLDAARRAIAIAERIGVCATV